jgi:adenine-specific DNA-methyltransferase
MAEIHKSYHLVLQKIKESKKTKNTCNTSRMVLSEVTSKQIKSSNNTPSHTLIEADNYHALSILSQTHTENIDLIYIDPPYNTGNGQEFMYSDKYNHHSTWLSFMETRLTLAHTLLKQTGAIFISIDDNEVAQLKILCNSIFGEENFVAQFIRKSKRGSGNDSSHIAIEFDYMLCYAKNKKKLRFSKEVVNVSSDTRYKLVDAHLSSRGKYLLRDLEYKGSYSTTLDYPINTPDGSIIYAGTYLGKPHTWRWSKEKVAWGITNDFIAFKKSKNKWKVYFKQYQFVDNEDKSIVRSLPYKAIIEFFNSDGSRELNHILPNTKFRFPKPVGLILFCINLFSDTSITILDFFAGSGTTGHAVLAANNHDGGTRQFILCTNNENKICTTVTYPRLKKLIKGYLFNGTRIKGLGGGLRYFKTTISK